MPQSSWHICNPLTSCCSDDAHTVLEDRTFIEQMKADILRRAEEISDDEEDEDAAGESGKGKAMAFEEELDDEDVVRVRDGHASEEDESETDGEDGGGTDVRARVLTVATCSTILTHALNRPLAIPRRSLSSRTSEIRNCSTETGKRGEAKPARTSRHRPATGTSRSKVGRSCSNATCVLCCSVVMMTEVRD